jgi:glucose/arabinose dehydrogenase
MTLSLSRTLIHAVVVLCLAALPGAQAREPRAASATVLPPGFSSEVIASGLVFPTTFVALPEGRLLIAEKQGTVRLLSQGVLRPEPFIDLRERINSFGDRGLLGMAVDPDFARNGYLYLLYTYEIEPADPDGPGPMVGRLARYTVVGGSASPQSELVLLGTQVARSCNQLPAGADCIPSDSASHSVAQVLFAPDGSLLVGTGDGARSDIVDEDALRAQSLDSLAGKLLRLSPTGEGLPTNPFWTGNARDNRSKVWSLGLRNPFRFTVRPSNGVPYLGDVGWLAYEEIDVATAGANFGWPCYEGPERQPGYASLPLCQALYELGPSAVKGPLYAWAHEGRSAAAVGGAFYTGTSYPSSLWGAYFFGDYALSWFRTLQVDERDELIPGSVTPLASEVGTPVELRPGPDGDMLYLSITMGELRRLRYTAGNTPPVAVARATPEEGNPPLQVQFSSAGSADADGDALTYRWEFGDGTPGSTLANPQHTYTAEGVYVARLTVEDGRGGSGSATVQVSVGNRAPRVSLISPEPSLLFQVGQVISLAGQAVDPEEGPVPGERLEWSVVLQHCTQGDCHAHPYHSATGPSGSFTVPNHADEMYFDITLSATDSAGLASQRTVRLRPLTLQVTLESEPAGLQLVYDGQLVTAPHTRTTIAGSTHTLEAPSPQGSWAFERWSTGGAQRHEVTVGTEAARYTATFVSTTPGECAEGEYRAEYFNNPSLEGSPYLVRCEGAPLAYDWGEGSPAPGVAADGFSVRWSGRFRFRFGLYRITARADDGVRVWVGDQLAVDAWYDQGPTNYSTLLLLSGERRVVMEYYENGGGAVAGLGWRRL